MATASNRTRIPAGGALGYALVKLSTADFDYDWQPVASGGGTWGTITGTVTDQTDLITYLSTNYIEFGDFSGLFDTGFAAKSTSNLAEGSNLYFTNSRVIDALPPQAGNVGKFLQTNGSALSWEVASSLDLVSYSYAGGF